MVEIRSAVVEDAPALAALIEAYMREVFPGGEWGGSQAALERDGFGRHFEATVVVRDGDPVGFAVWRMNYDLHNCIPGAEVIDMYLRPAERGRARVAQLVAAVAAEVQAGGGKYLQGLTVGETASSRRLYERVAIGFPGANVILGGAAFRTVAALAGKRAREIVCGLPDKKTNWDS